MLALGGFFGPLLVGYLNKRTGNFLYGFGLLGLFMLVGTALTYTLTPQDGLAKLESRLQPAPVEINGRV